MQHQIQGQEVTSHGKLSVGLTPDISRPAYLQENHNLTDNLPDGEDFGDVSGHLLSLLLPADRVPLISIEQLADAIDDGKARKSWLLNKFFYEESRGADHTRTDEIVSSCGSLREFLDLKTGQRASSAMNGGVL